MPFITKSDLKYSYAWPDDFSDHKHHQRHTSQTPDTTVLDCNNGHDVLEFINRFIMIHEIQYHESARKIENLLKEHLPEDTQSHKDVMAWLVTNWNKFD